MRKFLAQCNEQLAPVEALFFTWLVRVFLAASLVGVAWIDDAPPLEVAALIVAMYVAIRVASEGISFYALAPFSNKLFKLLFAALCLGLLGLSFLVVVIFTEQVALFVAG